MKYLALDVGDFSPGIPLIPMPVERFGHTAELDDEILRQVFRRDLAALLLPQPQQRRLIVAHAKRAGASQSVEGDQQLSLGRVSASRARKDP